MLNKIIFLILRAIEKVYIDHKHIDVWFSTEISPKPENWYEYKYYLLIWYMLYFLCGPKATTRISSMIFSMLFKFSQNLYLKKK